MSIRGAATCSASRPPTACGCCTPSAPGEGLQLANVDLAISAEALWADLEPAADPPSAA